MTISTVWTLEDLRRQFGPVPATRVRLDPAPGTAAEQDVVDIENREDRLYELFDGVLLEKAMGFYESYLASLLARYLGEFAEEHDLGIVTGEAGMLKLCPGEVRIPDVSFVSWDRLPGRRIPREPIPSLAPDLAVEVVSRSNTHEEMQRKLRDYFAAQVRLVWLVYPYRRSVGVFTSPTEFREFDENQSLEGGDVLPGFQLPLTQLFRCPHEDAGGPAS